MKTFPAFRSFTLAAALLAFAATAQAKLSIGDPAPKLQTGQWIQGDPVTAFDTNHVYIVEFWATWCGPCRASIPHLNELYEKFKDQGLIAIGQDVWEPKDDAVAPFVKKMGDKMTYRVALDDKSADAVGAMATTWMKAAGQNGIPAAFIVNRHGDIAWIGHPMSLTPEILEQILAGKFDSAAYAKKLEDQQQSQQQMLDQYKKLSDALTAKDWDAADAALAALDKIRPGMAENQFGSLQLKILLGRKDFDGAYQMVQSRSSAHLDNATLQNQLAWTLAITPGVDARGLALAKTVAERANTAAGGKEPAILDTLARTQFMTGLTNEAVANEQKAVDAATGGMKDSLQKTLADYQQGKLPSASE